MAAERVADLTVDEFKALIRQTLYEVLDEFYDDDPDAGLEFKPEVAAYLREALIADRPGIPAEEVARRLGIEVWPTPSDIPKTPQQS
ncbi:MAG: hypothetical protein ACYDBJ_16795 [Aggregatilineales bacterium]